MAYNFLSPLFANNLSGKEGGITVGYKSDVHEYSNSPKSGSNQPRRASLPLDSKREKFKIGIRKNLRKLFVKVFRIKQ